MYMGLFCDVYGDRALGGIAYGDRALALDYLPGTYQHGSRSFVMIWGSFVMIWGSFVMCMGLFCHV
jgi:hypothetical protein